MHTHAFKKTVDEVKNELKKTLDFDSTLHSKQNDNPVYSEVTCFDCSSVMVSVLENKFEPAWGIVFLILGVVASLFFIGIIFGFPLIIFGIYLLVSKSAVHKCPKCGNSLIIRKHHEY